MNVYSRLVYPAMFVFVSEIISGIWIWWKWYLSVIRINNRYTRYIDVRDFTNKSVDRITSTLIRSRKNNERLIGREWIYTSVTRLPVASRAVSGNHCQTIHIRVSIGCISIFFSATRSMPPQRKVRARSTSSF